MNYLNLFIFCTFNLCGLQGSLVECISDTKVTNMKQISHKPVDLDRLSDQKLSNQRGATHGHYGVKNHGENSSSVFGGRSSRISKKSQQGEPDDVMINFNVDQDIKSRGSFSRLFSTDNSVNTATATIFADQSNDDIDQSKESLLSLAAILGLGS